MTVNGASVSWLNHAPHRSAARAATDPLIPTMMLRPSMTAPGLGVISLRPDIGDRHQHWSPVRGAKVLCHSIEAEAERHAPYGVCSHKPGEPGRPRRSQIAIAIAEGGVMTTKVEKSI